MMFMQDLDPESWRDVRIYLGVAISVCDVERAVRAIYR